MLRHAFQFADRVLFIIGANNMRSQRAIERVGGVFVEKRVERDADNHVYCTAHSGWADAE